jgi:hypothetical protein
MTRTAGLCCALLLWTSSAALARRAAGGKPVVRRVVSIKQRTSSPSFTAQELRVVDRGRLLALGNGLLAEQETIHLLRLSDLKQLTVQAPLGAYVHANPGIKVSEQDGRPIHRQFLVQRLLFYDARHREAGIQVADRFGTGRVRRHFFMHWDLAKGQLTEATLVARGYGASHSDSLPLGYNHQRREFYYVRQIYERGAQRGKGRGRTLTIVGFKAGKPRVVVQFRSHRSMQRKTYFDAAGQRALLLEYAELADKDPAPLGFLVDLARGKVRSFEIPLTAYGAAFAPDGRTIFIYSSQLGELWQVDSTSGARTAPILKVGKQGHALGLVRPDSLLLVRNSGLRYIHLRRGRLRRGRFIRIGALYPGFSHVEGSRVVPGGALIRNGDRLYVTSLPAR